VASILALMASLMQNIAPMASDSGACGIIVDLKASSQETFSLMASCFDAHVANEIFALMASNFSSPAGYIDGRFIRFYFKPVSSTAAAHPPN